MNPYCRKKVVLAHTGYVADLQGHERFCLRDLLTLKAFNPEDIVHKPQDMPKIYYVDAHVRRRYVPDFWIPKENLIIEVKSGYTLKAGYTVNILKATACTKAGYAFEFWVYDRKGTLERVVRDVALSENAT